MSLGVSVENRSLNPSSGKNLSNRSDGRVRFRSTIITPLPSKNMDEIWLVINVGVNISSIAFRVVEVLRFLDTRLLGEQNAIDSWLECGTIE